MDEDRQTLWGVIDSKGRRLRWATAGGAVFAFLVFCVVVVVAGRVVGWPAAMFTAVSMAGGLLVFLVAAPRAVPAQSPLAVLPVVPEGRMALVDEALAGAMLATGTTERPDLRELPAYEVNAAVELGRPTLPRLAVTTGMFRLLDQQELEAVFTQLLVRGRMPVHPATIGRGDVPGLADAEAVRFLAYPDKLYSALRKTLGTGQTAVPSLLNGGVDCFVSQYPPDAEPESRLRALEAAAHLTPRV